jgi:hypothetical protein
MAIVAVNLTPKTYAEIMNLVAAGTYASLEQFVEIALFNQLSLEKGATPDEVVNQQRRKRAGRGPCLPGNSTRHTQNRASQESVSLVAAPTHPVARQRRAASSLDVAELQQVLGRMSLTQFQGGTVPPVALVSGAGKERIWGQVNRLFPVKLACRWLAVAATLRHQWPTLQAIAEPLASDAAVLGSSLEKADDSKGRKREEMLATGLPRKDNLQSRDRFLSQFVARVTRAGRIYPGAICHYGFARFDEEHLLLTGVGAELARLENPVLDRSFESVSATLSDKERSFLLQEIKRNATTEWEEFKVVVVAIGKGNTTPDSLLASVRAMFPGEWTDVAYRTHVYGIMARILDLGLLGKQWDGRRVQYLLTKSANEVLAA